LLRFLEHASRFIFTAIQVAAVADSRFKIADCVAELMDFSVDLIFASRAVYSAAIERTVHVFLEVFCETIEAVNGVAQPAIVVTSITTIISPLGTYSSG
jgi:hypothetical protein